MMFWFCLFDKSLILVLISVSFSDSQLNRQSLWTLVQSLPQLETLRDYVSQSGLDSVLSRQYSDLEKVTFFAPTNDAFRRMTTADKNYFTQYLQDSLKYHIVLDSVSYDAHELNRKAELRENHIPTMSGESLYITSIASAPHPLLFVNQALVQRDELTEWLAQNGRLQLIDDVIQFASSQNIYSYIEQPERNGVSMGSFAQLLRRLHSTDTSLFSKLSFGNRRTFLAVSNPGLEAIPPTKLEQLRNDPDLLKQVLEAQLIAETDEWFTGPLMALATSRGPDLSNDPGIRAIRIGSDVFILTPGFAGKVLIGDISCANGVLHVLDSLVAYRYNSVAEQLRMDDSLSSLLRFASAASSGTRQSLQATPITVFAPINTAFSAIPAENYSMISDDEAWTSQVLGLHVVSGTYRFNQLSQLAEVTQNDRNPIKVGRLGNDFDTFVERAGVRSRIVRFDVAMTNGVMHYVDRVLGVAIRDSQSEVKTNALTAGELGVTLAALPAASSYLASLSENKTFFAPSDAAMLKVRSDLTLAEIFNLQWHSKLEDVMKTHTLPRTSFRLSSLSNGDVRQLRTQWGTISVSRSRDVRGVDHYEVTHGLMTSRVVQADVITTNGVVHVIDTMLFEENDFYRVSLSPACGANWWWISALILIYF